MALDHVFNYFGCYDKTSFYVVACQGNEPSALSQLKSRIGNFGRIGNAAWHKEVCHAEVVRCSPDETRTS